MARIVEIVTNEWYDAARVKPPCGREVQCFVSTEDGVGYMTLVWNGWYWIDPFKGCRTERVRKSTVIAWYIFERYVDRKDV